MAKRVMWPNGLGFDEGRWEYMQISDGRWRCIDRVRRYDPRRRSSDKVLVGIGATPEEARLNARPSIVQ